jgi:flagellar biosynthetic protein FliP
MRGIAAVAFLAALLFPSSIFGQDGRGPDDAKPGLLPTTDLLDSKDDPAKAASTLKLILGIAVLAVAPAVLMLLTSFTRIVVVLCFLRRAMAAPDIPPTSVVMGLSFLLTIVVMSPTFGAIKRDALDPYGAEDPKARITQVEAFDRATHHMRQFMFRFARVKDIRLFLAMRGTVQDELTQADVPTDALVPAFVISELRRAFVMGFALFLPFLIIDLLVASGLLSMGMVFLPPTAVSLPFKVLLFVLVDGWHLVIGSLMQSFAAGPTTGALFHFAPGSPPALFFS